MLQATSRVAPTLAAAMPLGRAGMLDLVGTDISIGGHRGMGENLLLEGAAAVAAQLARATVHSASTVAAAAPPLLPAYRENTLRSFLSAAAAGASFVEFDVQVTRDGVPVVWHDDEVMYGDEASPTSCTISDLTLPEFEALGSLSAGGSNSQLSVVRRFKGAATRARAPRWHRWRCDADDSFPTLAALFDALPHGLGFDIEVKMATPNSLAVTPSQEIERMVTPILAAVEAGTRSGAAAERPIVFTSFDPDVCRELRARQSRWPVLLLSTGGQGGLHADPRRNSLAAALAFAQEHGLSGCVVDSAALAEAPETAALARAAHLKLWTYGLENDDATWVRRQAQLGVNAAIVDDVPGVLAGLAAAGPLPAQVAAVAAADEPTKASLQRVLSGDALPALQPTSSRVATSG